MAYTEKQLISRMAEFIKEFKILPTASEYNQVRAAVKDLPDESTIRTRLGGWQKAWRRALAEALAEKEAPAPPQSPSLPPPRPNAPAPKLHAHEIDNPF